MCINALEMYFLLLNLNTLFDSWICCSVVPHVVEGNPLRSLLTVDYVMSRGCPPVSGLDLGDA